MKDKIAHKNIQIMDWATEQKRDVNLHPLSMLLTELEQLIRADQKKKDAEAITKVLDAFGIKMNDDEMYVQIAQAIEGQE